MKTTLKEMRVGETCTVSGYVKGATQYREKLLAMGLNCGARFSVARIAPMGDPVEIEVREFALTVRKDEAAALIVEKQEVVIRDYIIGVVGNPNCGKTTLFNIQTGARQRVATAPGFGSERYRSSHHPGFHPDGPHRRKLACRGRHLHRHLRQGSGGGHPGRVVCADG